LKMPRSRTCLEDSKNNFYFQNGLFKQKLQTDEVFNQTSSSNNF
jgi:hypothetical protein